MDIIHVALYGSYVLYGFLVTFQEFSFIFGVKSLYKFPELFLEFESTLIMLSLIDLNFLHEAREPLWNLVHVIQPKYFIHLLERDLLPLLIDIINHSLLLKKVRENRPRRGGRITFGLLHSMGC